MRVPAQIVAHVEPALLVLKDAEGATPRNHGDFDAPRDRAALRLHGADVAAPRFGDGLRVTGRQRARSRGLGAAIRIWRVLVQRARATINRAASNRSNLGKLALVPRLLLCPAQNGE